MKLKLKALLASSMPFIALLSAAQSASLDSSFRINGKMIKPAGIANAVAITPNGKIVAAGNSSNGSRLVRYKSNGFIDKSFGVNGIATAPFGKEGVINSIAVRPNRKILVAGTNGRDFAIAKFNANGTLDSSFGINGKVTTDFYRKKDYATFVTVDSDKNIIAVGTDFDESGEAPSIAVARYKHNGTPDSSFGYGGKLSVELGNFAYGSTLILQPDKKIIVIGTYFHNPTEFDFVITRYHSDGTVDTSFGIDGFNYTDFDRGEDYPVAAALQSNGKIVVTGSTGGGLFGGGYINFARYTKNGRVDSTFARDGKITTRFGAGNYACRGMIIQSNDKIVVASSQAGIDILRFRKNGLPDRNFGSNGRVKINTSSEESVRAIVMEKNGEIIGAGSSQSDFFWRK